MLGFQHTEFLYALLALPVLVLLFWYGARSRRQAQALFGQRQLVDQLNPQNPRTRRILKFGLQLLALTFIVFALANLRMGTVKERVEREGSEVIVALDLSRSMEAEDLIPSRMQRAKIFASRLLSEMRGDKVGLVIFAGKAYQQMPLTYDTRAAQMFINILNTDVVPTQGTAIGEAIRLSMESFDNGTEKNMEKKRNRALIIITDGENHEGEALEMAQAAAEAGIKIFTIGVGTAKGAPIPMYINGNAYDYKKNQAGDIVLSKLDEQMLKDVAEAGKGVYYNISSGNQVINEIRDELSELEKAKGEEYEYTAHRYHFQTFLLIGLILLILDFLMANRRHGWLKGINLFDKQQKNQSPISPKSKRA